eukprot:gene25315-30568_t
MSNNVVTSIKPLSFPMETLDPFLFCVYHKDYYPAGDEKMRAPRRGNGADFDPKAPYRMYHGDEIPGFPQHPHRGFETLTATMEGLTDHTDSQGNAGRYGNGDLQWMTAGSGVVHGENFPLINKDKPNTLKLFQIWLNLPRKSKMVSPAFVMHWAEEIPKYTSPDGKTSITIWAGSLFGQRGLTPTPHSYANDPQAELAVWLVQLQPGGRVTLPAASSDAVNRRAYFVEGRGLTIAGQTIPPNSSATLKASLEVTLENSAADSLAEVLVLQGRPIGEPVAQHGPFVMNTMAEIQQAFADYRRTQFGGWPWPEDAVTFPREKGRFALVDGKEIYPPSAGLCRPGQEEGK